MPTDRFKLIASVYVLFVRDGKILMLRRANTGYMDGHYSLVAGHADGNEALTAATAREAKEEAGVVIAPANLRLKLTMHRRADDERLDFFFEPAAWTGEPQNMEPDKCDDSPLVPARRPAREHHSLHPRGAPLLSGSRGVQRVGVGELNRYLHCQKGRLN